MTKKSEKTSPEIAALTKSAQDMNHLLLENFVTLQKVMTDMAFKFDNLSENISKLLNLFEMSARSFIQKQPFADAQKDQEFLEKINLLLDQNKTIAKGLTLMEERIREKLYGNRPENFPENIPERALNIPSERMANMPADEMMPSLQNDRIKKLPRI